MKPAAGMILHQEERARPKMIAGEEIMVEAKDVVTEKRDMMTQTLESRKFITINSAFCWA